MTSILDHFVFPHMRRIQADVLKEVEEAYSSYDFVMLEAPTGTGKSAIAATAALWMGESYINTSSLLLQDQYLRDFGSWMKAIKGKGNFECVDKSMEQA